MKKPTNAYLSIKKIQSLTGLSYLTIYNKFSKGEIQGAFQMGRSWRISIEDWNKYVKELRNV